MKESLKVLQAAADIQQKKSNDYQNPNSRIKQADYYPHGCSTILDTMHAKILRMHSVVEAMESDPNYTPNFESLEDSCIDIINYASFFVSYSKGMMEGQSPDRDFLNRYKETDEVKHSPLYDSKYLKIMREDDDWDVSKQMRDTQV